MWDEITPFQNFKWLLPMLGLMFVNVNKSLMYTPSTISQTTKFVKHMHIPNTKVHIFVNIIM